MQMLYHDLCKHEEVLNTDMKQTDTVDWTGKQLKNNKSQLR